MKSKNLFKKTVLAIVIILCVALALLVFFHNDPMDNAGTARLKKISGISLIIVSCSLF